jgi:hypothetical protein
MKKYVLFLGLGTGFIAGSWAGRAPYEQLQRTARSVMKQPKVKTSLESAVESAQAARDVALDAATDAVEKVSDVAVGALDEGANRIQRGQVTAK